jgi:hypothetical protein
MPSFICLARVACRDDRIPYRPLDEMHGTPVQVDAEYAKLRIKAARIVDVRRWTSRFHSCISSRARLLHEGSGSAEHQTVLAPAELKEVDPANIDRIVSIGKVLLGPSPTAANLI